jgi:hypothetical protein
MANHPPFATLNHFAADLMVWNDPAPAASCARDPVVGIGSKRGGRFMIETTVIGLDIAKQLFQLHGVSADGKVTIRRQLRRSDVLKFFARLARWSSALKPAGVHTSGHASSVPSDMTFD